MKRCSAKWYRQGFVVCFLTFFPIPTLALDETVIMKCSSELPNETIERVLKYDHKNKKIEARVEGEWLEWCPETPDIPFRSRQIRDYSGVCEEKPSAAIQRREIEAGYFPPTYRKFVVDFEIISYSFTGLQMIEKQWECSEL